MIPFFVIDALAVVVPLHTEGPRYQLVIDAPNPRSLKKVLYLLPWYSGRTKTWTVAFNFRREEKSRIKYQISKTPEPTLYKDNFLFPR